MAFDSPKSEGIARAKKTLTKAAREKKKIEKALEEAWQLLKRTRGKPADPGWPKKKANTAPKGFHT